MSAGASDADPPRPEGSGADVLAVRAATRADLPIIGRLGALLVRTHHQFDPERFLAAQPQTEDRYAEFLGGRLESPDAFVLVAERAGSVMGYAFATVQGYDYMSLRGPAGVVHDLVVDPEHRRLGVGRALLDAALEALEARGVPRVVLSTAAKNQDARRLFEAAGFRPTVIEMTREAGGSASGAPEP